MSAPRGWRWLGNTALLVGGLCITFAAAEGLTRLFWKPPIPEPPPPLPKAWRALPTLSSMADLSRPDVNGLWAGVPYRTNHEGFRGPERTWEKPPNGFRVAVIGGSISMGWGVPEEDTYAARLERALAQRFPQRRVEVLNLGLAGLDTAGAGQRLEDVGLAFDPDLVVYGFTLNDLENDAYLHTRVDPMLDDGVPGPAPRFVLERILRPRYAGLAEVLWAPPGSYVHELDQNYFQNPAAWQPVDAALDRLAAITRERGICGVVLIHTRLHFLNALHPYHRHYAAIRAAAEARGLFPISSFHIFRGRKDRKLWVGPRDAHPGPEAHVLLAEALLEGLDALPPRCLGLE